MKCAHAKLIQRKGRGEKCTTNLERWMIGGGEDTLVVVAESERWGNDNGLQFNERHGDGEEGLCTCRRIRSKNSRLLSDSLTLSEHNVLTKDSLACRVPSSSRPGSRFASERLISVRAAWKSSPCFLWGVRARVRSHFCSTQTPAT